jgi:hypothetical protein
MEQLEKELMAFKLTNESIITILLNSNNKNTLTEILPIIRKYTSAIVINYKVDLNAIALVSVGKNTISLS